MTRHGTTLRTRPLRGSRAARWLTAGCTTAAVLLAAPLTACGEDQASGPSAQQAAASRDSDAAEAGTHGAVPDAVDERLAERRRALIREAQVALDETSAALQALDEGRHEEALEALSRATGKLELVLARDPELALAPVDVSVVTHDLYATPEAIRDAREEAEELLEEGEVQEARALLSGLASEIVIRVTNLPLATYPDAILEVSPLIDEGRIQEAKRALRTALSSLVLTDHVISLPALRARRMLEEAEALVSREETSEADRQRIDELVAGAREQLEMAELLGYGEEEEHEKFREQLALLERKVRDEEDTEGVFARLEDSLRGFQTSFFE